MFDCSEHLTKFAQKCCSLHRAWVFTIHHLALNTLTRNLQVLLSEGELTDSEGDSGGSGSGGLSGGTFS